MFWMIPALMAAFGGAAGAAGAAGFGGTLGALGSSGAPIADAASVMSGSGGSVGGAGGLMSKFGGGGKKGYTPPPIPEIISLPSSPTQMPRASLDTGQQFAQALARIKASAFLNRRA